jgi:hypothetical protein
LAVLPYLRHQPNFKVFYRRLYAVNPLAHSHDETLDFESLQPIRSLIITGLQSRLRLIFFVLQEGFMGNLDGRRVASGIALIITTLVLVQLHRLDYSRELQFFGIALVGVFGFLFLSSSEPAT